VYFQFKEKPLNILLTGADGYIGSHLKPYLEDNGHYVIEYEGDISDFTLPFDGGVVGYCDMVIHLAALVSVLGSLKNPDEYYKVNVKGFKKVIEECVAAKCKLIYTSSSNAMQWWTNPYAATKKINEELASDFNFIGVRPHNIYPGRSDMLYTELVNDPTSVKYINGKHYRDFTHINDFCSAILTLVENYSIIDDKIVDIGRGDSVSVLEVAESLGWNGEVRDTPTPNEQEKTLANTTLLKSLGWKPRHNILVK
jgi:nucleoside-diphosphate-sugar epimerase